MRIACSSLLALCDGLCIMTAPFAPGSEYTAVEWQIAEKP